MGFLSQEDARSFPVRFLPLSGATKGLGVLPGNRGFGSKGEGEDGDGDLKDPEGESASLVAEARTWDVVVDRKGRVGNCGLERVLEPGT